MESKWRFEMGLRDEVGPTTKRPIFLMEDQMDGPEVAARNIEREDARRKAVELGFPYIT